MPPPLIGITTHSHRAPDWAELGHLRAMIVRSVERAGGLPVIVPLELSDDSLRRLYERLDGLLFAGGGDVDPARYGADMHPAVRGVDAERDRTEIALARWAASERRPFFGICRGAQMVNVALGGGLYRDLSEAPEARPHTYYPGYPYDLRPHAIQIEEETTLARVIGQRMVTVNSLHHQAVRDLAPGLRASARAPDGLIEAVELSDHPFALAVQWHPEMLPDAPEMRRLFEALVEAARAAQGSAAQAPTSS